MHFMPDNETEETERFWPEAYKQVIRGRVQSVGDLLRTSQSLKHFYECCHTGKFADFNLFISSLAEMVTIGAENGADDASDETISSFLTESPLPEIRSYAHYYCPRAFSPEARSALKQAIIDEYARDNVYQYAYKVGYQSRYRDFDEFISYVAEYMVTGAVNSADDMIEAVYKSFLGKGPLPPARRRPKRLKMWSGAIGVSSSNT